MNIYKDLQKHTPLKSFVICNKYDSRTWCASNNSWVNDGRETAHYRTKEEADEELYYALADDDSAFVSEYKVQ